MDTDYEGELYINGQLLKGKYETNYSFTVTILANALNAAE
jgi:hypothetical protein